MCPYAETQCILSLKMSGQLERQADYKKLVKIQRSDYLHYVLDFWMLKSLQDERKRVALIEYVSKKSLHNDSLENRCLAHLCVLSLCVNQGQYPMVSFLPQPYTRRQSLELSHDRNLALIIS